MVLKSTKNKFLDFFLTHLIFLLQVLVLEAGEEPKLNDSIPGLALTNVTDGYAVFLKNSSVEPVGFPYGKKLGGTAELNIMIINRGNRADYDGWQDQGNHGWNWESVLPYFKNFETLQDAWVRSYPFF